MSSIPLSREHGLRPVIATCPRCGGKSNEIALVGNGRVWTCDSCKKNVIAYRRPPKCECGNWHFTSQPYDESMPIIGDLCTECEQEVAEHKRIVAEGGVYWECDSCPAEGVIKADAPFAQAVRKAHGIEPPGECGVMFEAGAEPACPVCGGTGKRKET